MTGFTLYLWVDGRLAECRLLYASRHMTIVDCGGRVLEAPVLGRASRGGSRSIGDPFFKTRVEGTVDYMG